MSEHPVDRVRCDFGRGHTGHHEHDPGTGKPPVRWTGRVLTIPVDVPADGYLHYDGEALSGRKRPVTLEFLTEAATLVQVRLSMKDFERLHDQQGQMLDALRAAHG